MPISKPKPPIADFCVELIGSHHQQKDLRLIAYGDDRKVVGVIYYLLFEGDVYIDSIDVLATYKRQRIGTQLIGYLARKYGYAKITWGYLVDDVAEAFYRSMQLRYSPGCSVLSGKIGNKSDETQPSLFYIGDEVDEFWQVFKRFEEDPEDTEGDLIATFTTRSLAETFIQMMEERLIPAAG
ncbi:MAG: hypothetical protein C0402_05240 [Thermodesulfovibrio sp.]|nr:hypothetical protein [Thermodesulfovibrio sp.]